MVSRRVAVTNAAIAAQGSRVRPGQQHDGQPDAVQRFRNVQQVAEPIGAIERLPRTYSFDGVECNVTRGYHEQPERSDHGQ